MPLVDSEYTLDAAQAAIAKSRGGSARGKILSAMSSENLSS